MNCVSCYDHDGSQVPAVAPNDLGFPTCEECIRRDKHDVIWLCETCGNERKIPAEFWLQDDFRCDPCATRDARSLP